MKLRLSPRGLRLIAKPVISSVACTWRMDLPEQNDLEIEVRAGRANVVLACWHEDLLPLLWLGRGMGLAVVVSKSRDGEYAAQVAESFGFQPIRGSSSRRAVEVLMSALRVLESGTTVAFTPDGPRGPRNVFKPGAALAAQRAGVPLVPIRAASSRSWRLRSWDQFMIPKPFAQVRVRYGDPIHVGAGDNAIPEAVAAAQQALNLLGAAA